MTHTTTDDQGDDAAPRPLRSHFVNNVLATAASYIEEDPALARDLLADLGSFLAYRLRDDLAPVTLAQELDFVRTYLRLEQARHGDRLEVQVDDADGDAQVVPLSVQATAEEVVARRLGASQSALRVAVRPAAGGAGVRIDVSGLPDGADPERVLVGAQGAS